MVLALGAALAYYWLLGVKSPRALKAYRDFAQEHSAELVQRWRGRHLLSNVEASSCSRLESQVGQSLKLLWSGVLWGRARRASSLDLLASWLRGSSYQFPWLRRVMARSVSSVLPSKRSATKSTEV